MLIRSGDTIPVFDNKLGLFVPCTVLIVFSMIVDDPINYDCPQFANYVIYTDGTQDEQGCTRVYASTYDSNSDDPEFYPIETEAEWEKIQQILDDALQKAHEMYAPQDPPGEPSDPDLPFS